MTTAMSLHINGFRKKVRRPRPGRRNGELSPLATPEYARLQEEYGRALDDLTQLQRCFVVAYLATGEVKQSILDAGYDTDRPDSLGAVTLQRDNVRRAVDAGRALFAEKYRVKADELLEELKLIAFSNFADYDFDDAGKPADPKHPKWRSVQSVKRRIVPRKGGEPEIHVEFKLHPKIDAIRLLGQHLGLNQGEGAEDQVRPPAVLVSGIDPAQVAGLPAPRAPDVIDAEYAEAAAPPRPDAPS